MTSSEGLPRSDLTEIINAMANGDKRAADDLLPLIYEELRILARKRISQEPSGQSLQATDLVHEVYPRLVGKSVDQYWDGRGHFFGAAAKVMRRILIDRARRKLRQIHGGDVHRVNLDPDQILDPAQIPDPHRNLLELDVALEKLCERNPQHGQLVELKYFAGLTVSQAAEIMEIPVRSAERIWVYVRAWLRCEIQGGGASASSSSVRQCVK